MYVKIITLRIMTKADAIKIFNGVSPLAEALSLGRHAIYMWPDALPQAIADRVLGVAWKSGGDVEMRARAFAQPESEAVCA